MGAETFDTIIRGDDMGAAFREAVRRAKHDYGHAGYSGTIAEKQSARYIGEAKSMKEAQDMAWTLIDAMDPRIDDKWGPAGAIEFSDKDGTTAWLFFGWASS
jgi:hypothetical protein